MGRSDDLARQARSPERFADGSCRFRLRLRPVARARLLAGRLCMRFEAARRRPFCDGAEPGGDRRRPALPPGMVEFASVGAGVHTATIDWPPLARTWGYVVSRPECSCDHGRSTHVG